MRKKGLYGCFVSSGVAFALLGLLWFSMVAQASPLDRSSEGPQIDRSLSASPLTITPTTIYLPMVLNKHPSCAIPPLNWASDQDAVFLRWRWPERCEGPATFRLYRNSPGGSPVLIADDIRSVTDPVQAEAILNGDWSVISDTMNITTTDQLHAVRVDNPLQAAYLANRFHRVALVYGWGYSDTTAGPGTVYTYSVEAIRESDGLVVAIGEVVAPAGEITPLPAPTGLTVTQVISEGLVGHVDWVQAQKNRKADRTIYLRWDAATTETVSAVSPPVTPPWLVGYDIYRSENPIGSFVLINTEPILPMTSTRPASDPITMPYGLHDYYFLDADPALVYSRTYYYRVAPRDLLGQPRDWADDEQKLQFSDYVAAVPRDTAPPPVPRNLTATPLHLDSRIVLTWTAQTTDTTGYRLYFSHYPTASVLASTCTHPEDCWTILAEISLTATNIFTHEGIFGPLPQDTPHWYRIRAVDAAGNLSAPSEPVYAVLHDRHAPSRPSIDYNGELLLIQSSPDGVEALLYCSVDDGPYRLWKILEPDAVGEAIYDLYHEYTPPVPTTLICQAQVVDANGNRSEFSTPTSLIELTPPVIKDPPASIITVISTTGSAEKGWGAVVHWAAEPTPGVKGFRLYRQRYPSGARVLIADETALGRDARVFTDTSVTPEPVYSYTVTIYRPPSSLYGTELELPSQPYLYEVIPLLGQRSRQIAVIPWEDHSFAAGSGTYLQWTVGFDYRRSVVFRSMEKSQGYVQLTPPLTLTNRYSDTDAEHESYWYIVLLLDWKSGEVIGRTEPWSAGATAARTRVAHTDAHTQLSHPELLHLASALRAPLRPNTETLPSELYLAWETEAVSFTIGSISYTVGSTLTNLSGSGVMTLGGGDLTTFTRAVDFHELGVAADGRVLTGTVVHLLGQEIAYPGGLTYTLNFMYLDRHAGTGDVTLPLPAYIRLFRGGGTIPYTGENLAGATVHPNLAFEYARSGLASDPCSVTTPTFYYEMNPLPLRIVPISTVSYTHMSIQFEDGVCTQYEERYNGTRPSWNEPDGSDRLLRHPYAAGGGDVWIGPHGLEGRLDGTIVFKWHITIPYDLALEAGGVWLQFEANQIVDGRLTDGSMGLLYFSKPPNYFDWHDTPDHWFQANFTELYVGKGGSLYGTLVQQVAIATPIEWTGFRVDDITYTLYIPPIEAQKMPWDEAIDQAGPREEIEARLGLSLPGTGLQSGVNKIGETDFTWLNCGREVTFTEGVIADAYLRRGGVSGFFTATISPGSDVEASIYGYTVYLTRFRLAFFDNENYDKDIAGDLSLPPPADIKLPLIDFHINTDGCVESARIRPGAEPVLGHWQIQTHPTAVEFRPDADPKFPDGMALWVLGRIEIPHLALPTDDGTSPDYESGLPLDMSLTPDSEFYAFEWKEESGRYLFDGFDLLIEEIRLSGASEQPTWAPAATLGDPPCTPPACSQGFVALQGHLLTPLFGELEKGGAQPGLQSMVGSDFVGFTEPPHVRRGWTDKVGFGFEFDLVYAHDADEHGGRFVAWDQERFVQTSGFLEMFTLDWATAIDPGAADVYFGLSTVPALLRNLAETTMMTVPVTFTEELTQAAWTEWFPALGLTDTLTTQEAQGYLSFGNRLWTSVTSPSLTTEKIDALKDEDIPTTPKGGGTINQLATWGVHFDKLRGQAAFSEVRIGDEVVDYHLEELRISLQMNIDWSTGRNVLGVDEQVAPSWFDPPAIGSNGEGSSFIRAKRITFQITRDGDYAIVGKGVRTNLSEYLNKTIDFALLLNITDRPRLEGGLIIYKLNFEAVKFQRIGGVFGIGDAFFYLGGLGDAKFQGMTIGGAFLFGTIYADSLVLREMGFADLLDRLGDTGHGDVLVGGYLRVYGDFPIYNLGCLFKVNVGGEVAAWYFAALHGSDNAWGGRLRGYVYGKLLCVVSARGDLTLEIFHPGHAEGEASYALRGQFWVAGGIGFCEPNKWKSWESRWWKDKWCWTCGAVIQADYNDTKPDNWAWDYDADCE